MIEAQPFDQHMPTGKLKGRTAIVTGGGGAIGGAIARLYAAEGANLVICDIDGKKAEDTASDIVKAGGKAAPCAIDVSKPEDCARAVQIAAETYGNLRILVNVAAAIVPDGTVVDLAFEDWNKALAVNLSGPFLMCKYAIPEMRKAGGGSIVNIASQLGQLAVPKRAPYCTSKAALIMLTQAMAIDHAADDIRVNSLSPGAIDTPRALWRYNGDIEEARKARGPMYLLKRPGKVEEVAYGALFLASDESSFMTASDLLIDGGYIAHKTLETKTVDGPRA
ncbi:MAG TPA: glucose 1-dehydrogenase [Alphaproteobacteria bacterium]|nr:glucose 1-dehydrogenase [Alphaproteobacteria bacterium]